MRRAIPLLAAAAVAAAPLAASAKAPPPGYVMLKLGGYFPVAHDVDRFDAGIDGEVVAGYAPDPGFAFEGGVGWFTTSDAAASRKLRAIPVTFSIKGTVPVGEFQPYAVAGIGAYFIHDEVGAASDDSVDVGFHLGVGANWNLTRNLFVGLEGRYLWVRAGTLGVTTRMDGITLTADVGFRF